MPWGSWESRLAVRRRITHPHGILAAPFDIEYRLVGQGEQARAIRGVFRIGSDTEAGLNMHLQPAGRQERRLAQRPPQLLGLVERLLLAQARQDHYELVAPVAHAKGRRAHTLPDRRGDLLQGSGPVEMPVRVPYGPVKKDHVHIIAPSRICIPQKTS